MTVSVAPNATRFKISHKIQIQIERKSVEASEACMQNNGTISSHRNVGETEEEEEEGDGEREQKLMQIERVVNFPSIYMHRVIKWNLSMALSCVCVCVGRRYNHQSTDRPTDSD